MKRKIVITSLCCFALLSAGWLWRMTAQQQTPTIKTTPAPPLRIEPAKESDATGKTVAAARAFLATLDDAGRAKVSFPFNSDQKYKWSNFPTGIFQRNGLRMGDLSAAQREAAMNLLAAALSQQGLQKVKEIMEGDEVLRTSGMGPGGGPPPGGGRGPGGGRLMFSRDEYYLALLGALSLTEPWMIQFGGHHLAINLTMAGKANVLAPSLPAAQPATFKLNGETVRPLGREYDKGFALINALNAEQQKQAILPYQVSNLVLGAGEDGKTIQPEGIKVSALNAAQQEKLLGVVREWVGIMNDEATAAEIDGRRATPALVSILFPSRSEMNEGIGAIRLTLAAASALSAAGEHQLSFRNDHLPELGVYLANALVPTTDAIKITGQERDAQQHGLRINFHATPAVAHAGWRWTGVFIFCLCLALFLLQWKRLRSFLRPFDDEQINAKKTNCRNGIQLGSLNATQLAAALEVIKAAMGTVANEGSDEFNQTRLADGYLGANGGGSGYSDGIYFLSFLNTPSTTGAWMLQFGGHHYGANIAYNQGHVVGPTPQFEALEPLSFTSGGTTYAPLAQERDALAAMLASLNSTQLATAKLSTTFSDTTMSPGESNGGNGAFPTTKVGIAVSTLSDTQKQLALAAMKPWVQDMDDTVAANLLSIYQSELDGTYIAFTGNGTAGDASSFLVSNTNQRHDQPVRSRAH
jgi:hypothetical protein